MAGLHLPRILPISLSSSTADADLVTQSCPVGGKLRSFKKDRPLVGKIGVLGQSEVRLIKTHGVYCGGSHDFILGFLWWIVLLQGCGYIIQSWEVQGVTCQSWCLGHISHQTRKPENHRLKNSAFSSLLRDGDMLVPRMGTILVCLMQQCLWRGSLGCPGFWMKNVDPLASQEHVHKSFWHMLIAYIFNMFVDLDQCSIHAYAL